MISRFKNPLLILVLSLIPFFVSLPNSKDSLFIPQFQRKSASTSPIQFTSSTLYGPYVGGESVKFEWSYKNVSSNNYSSVNDYFIVSCPSYSSAPLISRRVSRHSLNAGSSYNCSYTYVINNVRFVMESGLVIKVGVFFNNSYIGLLEKTIKPIESRNINPLDYRSSPYLIRDRSFYLNENDVEESFLFDEYRDYVECDEYNRLLFSNLTFKYRYPRALIYDSVKIKFIDRNNLFPLLPKDGDDYVSIIASLNDNDGTISIEPASLYYDPVTLVSNVSGNGKKSKYLYVPKGKSQKLNGYEFIFEANQLGINKTSFSHYMEVSISPFYLGDCDSGDYCVVGGVRE